MPWRTALFSALRPGGSAPATTRVGLAVVGGAIILAAVYVGLEVLRGSELSEMALILFGMIFLAGLALIQAGKNGENVTRSAGGDDHAAGHDRMGEGPGTDKRPDSDRRTGGRR